MFFNRYQRIKTEPKIPGRLDDDFRQNKHKLKIKNIRFSFDQDIDKASKHLDLSRETDPKPNELQKEPSNNIKKLKFLQKLPEIGFENREAQTNQLREKKQLSMQQYRRKDALLNSILDILRPNRNNSQEESDFQERKSKEVRESGWKIDTSSKQYVNEFSEEVSQAVTTKHHRTPKIIENQLMRFKNSHNIVRRKIYSEDKDRHQAQKDLQDSKKLNLDLEKIQILTFANKFPNFKKDPIS